MQAEPAATPQRTGLMEGWAGTAGGPCSQGSDCTGSAVGVVPRAELGGDGGGGPFGGSAGAQQHHRKATQRAARRGSAALQMMATAGACQPPLQLAQGLLSSASMALFGMLQRGAPPGSEGSAEGWMAGQAAGTGQREVQGVANAQEPLLQPPPSCSITPQHSRQGDSAEQAEIDSSGGATGWASVTAPEAQGVLVGEQGTAQSAASADVQAEPAEAAVVLPACSPSPPRPPAGFFTEPHLRRMSNSPLRTGTKA
jgi:hypothetical protein